LEPLPLQYKDYSEWQSGEKQGEKLKKQENYWLKQLSPPLPTLVLPFDHPRPGVQTYAGSAVDFKIGEKETRQLKELAKQEGVTLQMIMVAIFHILLAKMGDREDIVTGTTSAGRRHADLETIIGPFINTLVLRSFPSGKKTFREFLNEVREISLNAYENQDYPFDFLVKKTAADRETGRNPIFDIMFEIQGAGAVTPAVSKQEIPGLKCVPYEMETDTTKFDQDWLGVETAEGIDFTAAYSTELFKPETVELMIEGFLKLTASVVVNPQAKIKELDCRTSFQKELKEVENIAFNF
jgi:non-ribosomal peptide synthetase component F